ncbi:hypothetical protein [Pseudonocardia alni]|uniref:Uncharacterized protein n=1 Tax=Pseudonocardia alni TaxID=33907 RepID=A0A852VWF3_PSEA5|nr:hypothetical protein [Pseudonocardia antarctica]NYG00350.1 hypothetical protein [Pseudonocardia antarctica]
MDAWWWVAAVVAATAPAIVVLTVRPTARCWPCRGLGTLRGDGGRWERHCDACRGWGRREREARVMLRQATGGRLFPDDPCTGRRFGGNAPFYGGWPRRLRRAARRRRAQRNR